MTEKQPDTQRSPMTDEEALRALQQWAVPSFDVCDSSWGESVNRVVRPIPPGPNGSEYVVFLSWDRVVNDVDFVQSTYGWGRSWGEAVQAALAGFRERTGGA